MVKEQIITKSDLNFSQCAIILCTLVMRKVYSQDNESIFMHNLKAIFASDIAIVEKSTRQKAINSQPLNL